MHTHVTYMYYVSVNALSCTLCNPQDVVDVHVHIWHMYMYIHAVA